MIYQKLHFPEFQALTYTVGAWSAPFKRDRFLQTTVSAGAASHVQITYDTNKTSMGYSITRLICLKTEVLLFTHPHFTTS